MKWPKLPNRKSFLDKGYTSIQMREYAKRCVEIAIAELQDDLTIAYMSGYQDGKDKEKGKQK